MLLFLEKYPIPKKAPPDAKIHCPNFVIDERDSISNTLSKTKKIIPIPKSVNPIFGQEKDEQLFNASLKNDTELFKKILNEGANVNYIKSVGPWMKVNSLIYSVRNKNIEITKLLLENGIDVNWKDGFNSSAIMYAAYTGKLNWLNYYLNMAEI